MDNYGIAARIREFDQRNGGNPVFFRDWLWYVNGAMREPEALGALIDPPTDEFDRLTNILRYHQGRLAEAVRAFENFREQLLNSPCPSGDALDRLKQLQTVVGEKNQAVEAATKSLAGTERARQMERRKLQAAEDQRRQKEFRESVRAIRI